MKPMCGKCPPLNGKPESPSKPGKPQSPSKPGKSENPSKPQKPPIKPKNTEKREPTLPTSGKEKKAQNKTPVTIPALRMSITLGNVTRAQFTPEARYAFKVAIAAADTSISPGNVHILLYGRRKLSVDVEILLPGADASRAPALSKTIDKHLLRGDAQGFRGRFAAKSGLQATSVSISPSSLVRASPPPSSDKTDASNTAVVALAVCLSIMVLLVLIVGALYYRKRSTHDGFIEHATPVEVAMVQGQPTVIAEGVVVTVAEPASHPVPLPGQPAAVVGTTAPLPTSAPLSKEP